MGLFNSGKNEKVEKVSKYERHYNVPQTSSRRRSSKHRSHQGEPPVRAMSQPPLMRANGANGGGGGNGGGGFYQAPSVFSPGIVGSMNPNVMGPNVLGGNVMSPNMMPHQIRYPMQAFDLSKYTSPAAFPSNPFNGGQMAAMNLAPIWNNGLVLANNRSPFQQQQQQQQQPMNDYQQQQGGWPGMSPSNYAFMPPMQF